MTRILYLLAMAVVMISRGSHTEDNHDAWKVIQAFEKHYLAYTTNQDTLFECASFIRQSIETSNMTAVYTVSFELADSTDLINLTVVELIYGAPDTIGFFFNIGVDQEIAETLIYTDYKTCFATKFPRDGKMCTLWLSFDATKEDVNTCLDDFKSLCGEYVTNVYGEDRCGVPE